MRATIKSVSLIGVAALLVACGGGGGGGGGGAAAPAPAPGGGGGSSGGGGGTPPAGTVIEGGLVPGGGVIIIDTGASGVDLDVASGGTGANLDFGDIQDFGSIILNDVTINTDSAEFEVEGAAATQDDLKQGQQVLVITDASGASATGVHYRSNVKGPVTAASIVDAELGTATFTVLGQVVRTDATTSFSDVDLANIAVGNLLEVSGTLNAAGDIQASFVELKTALTEYKATGEISAVSTTEFSLNGLTVDYSSATLRDFDGPVSDGDVVEVKGAAGDFASPDQLLASSVEQLPSLTVGASTPARIEGFIDRFSSASDFDVQTAGVSADASTRYVNGSAASLGLNVKVQAEGVFDASGVLVADTITIQPTEAVRAEGPVEAVSAANGTLTVLGLTFATRDLTRFEDKSSTGLDPFALADIGQGDEVAVRGYLDGSQLVATRIERDDPRDRARLRGPITAEDAAATRLDIQGVSVTAASGITEYRDLSDAPISATEFFDQVGLGTFVKADWDVFVDTDQPPDELSIED